MVQYGIDPGAESHVGSANCGDNSMVVAVRIRPMSTKEMQAGAQKCCKVVNGRYVIISKAGIAGRYLRSQQGSSNEYAFDVAFDADATQAEVYEQTAKMHVPSVLDGYNVSILAYGATGAGKTFTMMGSSCAAAGESAPVTGVIPQSLSDVFATIERRKRTAPPNSQWQVFCSYMEVYNEQIYDLIGPGAGRGQPLQLREDPSKGVVVVAGLPEMLVRDTAQVLDLLRQGNRNRKTEATAANQVSSRSHAVLQICVRFSTVDAAGHDLGRESRLSLIDLAGSERASATLNRGARLQEGANINKSLLALANCINALSENSGGGKANNVKYRDSKLTHLLKTSLEGQCKVVMLVNVNPCDAVFDDSHNAIKYGHRAKQIKIRPGEVKMHLQEAPWHEREARLKADNEAMRRELEELKSLLVSQQHTQQQPYTGRKGTAASKSSTLHYGNPHPSHARLPYGVSEGGGIMGMSTLMDVEEEEEEDEYGHGTNSSHYATDTGSHSGSSHSQLGRDKPLGGADASVYTGDTPVHHRVRELETVLQEMTRTRKLQQQFVANLEAQKQEKDEELQGQRRLVRSLQNELREREQESQSLREMVIHLRTRLESAKHTNYAFTDEDDDMVVFPPRIRHTSVTDAPLSSDTEASVAATVPNRPEFKRARASNSRGRSSVPMVEALEDMFSPIKTVAVLGAAAGGHSTATTAGSASGSGSAPGFTAKRKSSMATRECGSGATTAAKESSAKAPPSAAGPANLSPVTTLRKTGVKRRQSQIPRPAFQYSTRRASILSSTNTASDKAPTDGSSSRLPSGKDRLEDAPDRMTKSGTSSKKRTWENALNKENVSSAPPVLPTASLNAANRHIKRRESSIYKSVSMVNGQSNASTVALRTRSRMSTGPGARF